MPDRRTPGGKGDRSRITNHADYRVGYDRINWSDLPAEVEDMLIDQHEEERRNDDED